MCLKVRAEHHVMSKVKGRAEQSRAEQRQDKTNWNFKLKAVLLIKNSIIKARNQRTFNAIDKLESMTYHKIKVLIIYPKLFKS